ncbi:MAG: hypothetical protein MRZ61_10010 [Oscillospiraceae bacterium]|nr:hypothetical protein [Oscillospiraceae bacterium]
MDFFNAVADKFQQLGNSIIQSLPGSPVQWIATNPTIQKYLGWVNWFIPIQSIVAVYEVWLVCILIYYMVQAILRWVKVIE